MNMFTRMKELLSIRKKIQNEAVLLVGIPSFLLGIPNSIFIVKLFSWFIKIFELQESKLAIAMLAIIVMYCSLAIPIYFFKFIMNKIIIKYNGENIMAELLEILSQKEFKIELIEHLNQQIINQPDVTLYEKIIDIKKYLLTDNNQMAIMTLYEHIEILDPIEENVISQSEKEKLLGVTNIIHINNNLIENEKEINFNYKL